MKKIIYFISAAIILNSCSNKGNVSMPTFPKYQLNKFGYFNFLQDSALEKNYSMNVSTLKEIFMDTIKYCKYLDKNNSIQIIPDVRSTPPEDIARAYSINMTEITDTFIQRADTSDLNAYINAFKAFDEPLLSNFYSGKDIYRITRIYNDYTLIINISNENKTIITVKQKGGTKYDYKMLNVNKAPILKYLFVEFKRQLPIDIFKSIDSLFMCKHFNTLSRIKNEYGFDCCGLTLIESHNRFGYYFISRRFMDQGTVEDQLFNYVLHISDL